MPAPSYRRAIELGCFIQLPLFGADELRKQALARGLLDFPLVSFEALDREGLFAPVGYTTHPIPSPLHQAALAQGDLLLREEQPHQPWEADELSPLYAHWQLITLGDLHDTLSGRSPLLMLAGGREQLQAELQRRADALEHKDFDFGQEGLRRQELMLARMQSLFMPLVLGRQLTGLLFDREANATATDISDWANKQRRRTRFVSTSRAWDVDADDLAQLHDYLASQAERLDPLLEWRDLVDRAPRRRIEQLTGQARRAQDFYDAAEVVRLWHLGLTGEGSLSERRDESRYLGLPRAEINNRLYGFERLRGNRAALPGIHDQFGLYPWKVMLITEGPGDAAMLEAIVEVRAGRSFAELGIVTHDMGGSGWMKKGSRKNKLVTELLAALRRFPNYFLLVFDNEGTVPQSVSRLETFKARHPPFENAPVLEPQAPTTPDRPPEGWSDQGYTPKARPEAHVWDSDIEADNFTDVELCRVIRRMAADDERLASFSLSVKDLRRAQAGCGKGMARVAVDLCRDLGFRLSKVDLDRELGRYALTHPELYGRPRPVVMLAEHLFRLTNASRSMRGRLRESERR